MKRASRILLVVVVIVVGLGAAGVAILKTLDFNQYRAVVAEKVFEATGRKLTIAGDLDLAISFSPALRLEGVTFANADWGTRPEMAKLDRLEAQVELIPLLSGEARITRILVSGLDVLVETDAEGQGNWTFGQKEEAAPAATEGRESSGMPVQPVVQEVVLENAKVTYRDGTTGASYTVDLESLTARTEGPQSPIDLAGQGNFSGAAFRFDGQVGNLAAVSSGDSFPFAIKASALDADLSAEGVVEKPMEGAGIDVKLGLTAADLAKTVKELAAVAPNLAGASAPAGAVSLSGHVRQTATGISLSDLDVKLGPSDLTGSATVDLSAAHPRVTAEIASKSLDLAALAPAGDEPAAAAPAAGSSGGGAEPQKVFTSDPLPLDGLRAVDANVSVKVDHLVVPGGLALDGVLVTLVLDRGKLTVAPLRTEVAGGTLEGEFRIDGSQQVAPVDLMLNGKGIVVGDAMGQMGSADLIEGGPADIDIRLNGRGASMHDVMASLDGRMTVEVGEGRLLSKAVDVAGADVLTQLVDAVNPTAEKQDHSALSCAVVNFNVAKGVATAENGIAVETDKVNVIGAGTVDLGTEMLDLTVVPKAKSGVGINLSSAVAGLVRVQGSLNDPTVGIDKAGAAKAALSVGAALATGGLSVLGQALISKTTQDDNPCLTALGKAPPEGSATAPAEEGAEKTEAPAKSVEDKAKKALEGVGDAIGNIFGGKK